MEESYLLHGFLSKVWPSVRTHVATGSAGHHSTSDQSPPLNAVHSVDMGLPFLTIWLYHGLRDWFTVWQHAYRIPHGYRIALLASR